MTADEKQFRLADLGRRFYAQAWIGVVSEYRLYENLPQCKVKHAQHPELESNWLNTFEHVGLSAAAIDKPALVFHPDGDDEIGFLVGLICTASA